MSKNSNIIIVGAGPAGCYLGRLLQQGGVSVELLEEHPEVGRPVACAGVVGKETLDGILPFITQKSIKKELHQA